MRVLVWNMPSKLAETRVVNRDWKARATKFFREKQEFAMRERKAYSYFDDDLQAALLPDSGLLLNAGTSPLPREHAVDHVHGPNPPNFLRRHGGSANGAATHLPRRQWPASSEPERVGQTGIAAEPPA